MKNSINFKTKNKLCLIAGGMAIMFALQSCSIRDGQTESISSEPSTIYSYETEEVIQSTPETSIEVLGENATESESNEFTIETRQYTSPFNIYELDERDLHDLIVNNLYYDGQAGYYCFGFDNEYLRNNLINLTNQRTGELNENITMADYHYFQFTETTSMYQGSTSFYDFFTNCQPVFDQKTVRAVLQEQGLRFLIDEIPASYFEERFPEFMESLYENGDVILNQDLLNEFDVYSINNPSDIPSLYDYDALLFTDLVSYNSVRASYIYNYPHGDYDSYTDDVLQVRDELTGRNVLVPTDEQYNEIMDEIHQIPGFENIDIYQVETREEFYNSYGCYPEDVVNDEYIYEGNNRG